MSEIPWSETWPSYLSRSLPATSEKTNPKCKTPVFNVIKFPEILTQTLFFWGGALLAKKRQRLFQKTISWISFFFRSWNFASWNISTSCNNKLKISCNERVANWNNISWMAFWPTFFLVPKWFHQKLPPVWCVSGMFGLGGTFRATGDDYRLALACTMASKRTKKRRNDFGVNRDLYESPPLLEKTVLLGKYFLKQIAWHHSCVIFYVFLNLCNGRLDNQFYQMLKQTRKNCRAGNRAWIFMTFAFYKYILSFCKWSATSHFHQLEFNLFVDSCWKFVRVWLWQLACYNSIFFQATYCWYWWIGIIPEHSLGKFIPYLWWRYIMGT